MLVQAQWLDAKLDAHARLADAYRAERARIVRRTRFVRSSIALAASVMIVFGLARFVRVRQPKASMPMQPVSLEKKVPIVRPMTKLESAIVEVRASREAVARAQMRQPVVKKPPVIADVSAIGKALNDTALPIDRRQILLVQLLNDGSPNAIRTFLDSVAKGATRDVSLAALDGVNDPPIERFITALRDPLVDRRIAAARALGYIDGPALTSRLIKMAEADESRREAMVALACSRGEAAQRYLQRAAEAGPMVGLARSVRVQYDVQ